MEMAILACLRQKNHPLDPIDLIDDFEIGAKDVKEKRLRRAIWKELGEEIRQGLCRLFEQKKVVFTEDGKLVLTEVYEAVKRGTVLTAQNK